MEYSRERYVNMLKDRERNGLIKIITGARRAGKSYVLNELFFRRLIQDGVRSSRIIRFAFDSDEDVDLLDDYYPDEDTIIVDKKARLVNAKKFRAYVKDRINDDDVFYLFLDEVQLLENFVGTLNGFLRHKNLDIYVTGSNSRFLSTDIATEFKGRGSIVHVYPLSFSEYMEGNVTDEQSAWKEYIETGGIPLVSLMKTKDERITYLSTLCEETYLKDIIERNQIRKSSELSDTFDVLASMIGSPVSVKKLCSTFQSVTKKTITDDTLSKFITYFDEAFLISKAERYSIKGRKYIGAPYKVYFEDIGVRNARLSFRQIEETHIMENILYNELRYRGYCVDVGMVDVNERTDRKDKNGQTIYSQKHLEVDFVASKGSERIYIQSALSVADPAKLEQEKRPFLHIDDSYEKILITKNGLNKSIDENGIVVIDLFEFLCGKW